jgi:hypothetical protein
MDHYPPSSVPEPAKTSRFIWICACFKPLNVFVPPALLLMALGVVKGAIDYAQQQHLITLTGHSDFIHRSPGGPDRSADEALSKLSQQQAR